MRKNAPYDQKTVIPAAAKRRAGIQKPLKCLDSRFRGNDDKSSSIASFRAVSEFFRTLLSALSIFPAERGRDTEYRSTRRSANDNSGLFVTAQGGARQGATPRSIG
jgi:hypothetical protein